jgi:NTP pyrophosphatase (non-canonical NTP hydrolase)
LTKNEDDIGLMELRKTFMDKKITVEQLKIIVQKFCEERDWDQFHGPKDLAVGIVTEAAELLDHFRFKNETEAQKYLANSQKRTEVEEEVADTLFMLLRFAQMHNIDLTKALKRKIEINNKKYPIHKSKGNNKKYTDL